jgi:hypothetical protein
MIEWEQLSIRGCHSVLPNSVWFSTGRSCNYKIIIFQMNRKKITFKLLNFIYRNLMLTTWFTLVHNFRTKSNVLITSNIFIIFKHRKNTLIKTMWYMQMHLSLARHFKVTSIFYSCLKWFPLEWKERIASWHITVYSVMCHFITLSWMTYDSVQKYEKLYFKHDNCY